MKTQAKKIGDAIVVTMDGRLDFETHIPLRESLSRILEQSKTDSVGKIIFNLERLEFVGSSGISAFVQALKEFNSSAATRPIYCNVKSEFRRIIKAFDSEDLFDFDENTDRSRRKLDN